MPWLHKCSTSIHCCNSQTIFVLQCDWMITNSPVDGLPAKIVTRHIPPCSDASPYVIRIGHTAYNAPLRMNEGRVGGVKHQEFSVCEWRSGLLANKFKPRE